MFEVDLELYLCILDFLDRRHINRAMMPITRNTALHTLITTVSAGPTEIKFGVGPKQVYGLTGRSLKGMKALSGIDYIFK